MGLALINKKLKSAKNLNKDLEKGNLFKKIIKANQTKILNWNRNEQLFRDGIDNEGKKIWRYAPMTVELKILSRKPYDRVTLRQTGAYHKSFYIIFTDDSFKIFAKDKKTPLILDPQIPGRGPKTLGLTPSNQKRLVDEILKPGLQEEIRKIL